VTGDDLVDAAVGRAGLDRFGGDSWREGLEVLVDSINREANLNDLGRQVVGDQIVGHLVNRLQVEQCYRDHPEIEDQEIVAPLFGLGMPRTGSTALSFLLAEDPDRRSLRTWEAAQPCPPPETATESTDGRIAAAQAGIDITNQMFPDFLGMLPSSATGPQECILVMALEFRSQVFEGMSFVPAYSEWLFACDMEPAYRYHRRVLKLLQWHCPPTRWWLKSPAHMQSIVALDAVYPDARFVMTHRDVGTVLPSVCAVMEALSAVLAEQLDPHALGRHNTEVWRESLRRLIAFRDDGHEDRFFDVGFLAMQQDPLGAIEQLYGDMGDELSDRARDNMGRWWAERSREAGSSYTAEHFGLDAGALREEFAFYHRRFGIPA
jgi:hypothetical protein